MFSKSLKIVEDNVFFWADLHCGHNKDFIYKPRGFNSSEEADSGNVAAANSIVTNNDTLILLGDTVVNAKKDSFKKFDDLLHDLQYKHLFLMPGNHPDSLDAIMDKYWVESTRYNTYHRLDVDGRNVYIIPNYFEIKVKGQKIVLCHYPIASHNKAHHNSWMVHGHCHGSLKNSELGKLLYQNKVIDVGVECFSKPVEFEQLKVILDQRTVAPVDHHN